MSYSENSYLFKYYLPNKTIDLRIKGKSIPNSLKKFKEHLKGKVETIDERLIS